MKTFKQYLSEVHNSLAESEIPAQKRIVSTQKNNAGLKYEKNFVCRKYPL